ncbi:unnamed protein product [Brachionus calyciflorus]|uniref:HAT C-terminal dimerisation domain-containing protein n=1 Tax=Brachionus calyciflorus TaxID=104777 RepID=A0A814IM61_9BILA|nr:unnamed protein product [Brachionus calyciflorus]
MSTPLKRVQEFSSKPLSVKKQKLVCNVCNKELDFMKRSSIVKHLESDKHVTNEAAYNSSRTLNFDEDPVHNFRRDLYLKPGFNVPSTTTVRRLLPKVYEEEYAHLKNFFNQAKVAIICDETTDSMGRSVFQVLLKKLDFNTDPNPKLIDTCFLETVDYSTISRAVVNALIKINVDFNNVMSFITDNASYMLKAFKTTIKTLMPNCTHVTCFAHIISLVGETWRSNLNNLDQTVANFKSIFSRSNYRKQRFLEFQKNEGVEKPQCFPAPVVTRWNTWFKAVKFISENFEISKKFVLEEIKLEDTLALNKLKLLFEESELEIEFKFVSQRCDKFKFAILRFEEQNLKTTKVYNLVSDLYFWLTGQLDTVVYDKPEENLLAKNLFKEAIAKLKKYMFDGSQPGMEFFKAARIFDPAQAIFFNANLSELKIPFNIYNGIVNEWPIYIGLIADLNIEDPENIDLEKWWCQQKNRLPNMFEYARWIINLPSTSCDSERALSKYKIALADNRQNMSDETILITNFLYFNTNRNLLNEANDNNDLSDNDEDFIALESDKEN